MSGKGKKKSKNLKTINLSSFLADDKDVPTGYTRVKPVSTNWADAMEDEALDDRMLTNVVLPTAPKASRGPSVDLARVPNYPPFKAYIGNLPYDIMEDDIIRFFKNMKVLSVELPKESRENTRSTRGFGYVEFETRDDLLDALSLDNERLQNRVVKINLADERDHHNGDRRRGGGGSGNEEHASDWRAKDNGPWRNESRDSYRSRDGRRYDDDKFGSRERRGGDSDNSWRRGGPSHSGADSGASSYSDRPKERQRLVLLPRTAPKEEEASSAPPPSIFGGAKPVNTYTREQEIVEKKLKTLEVRAKSPPAPSTSPVSKPSPPNTSAKSSTTSKPATKSSIFGDAKPVDTAAREMEIEQKLRGERPPPQQHPPPQKQHRSNRAVEKVAEVKTQQKEPEEAKDYICSNKFSNLVSEDSGNEEPHDSN